MKGGSNKFWDNSRVTNPKGGDRTGSPNKKHKQKRKYAKNSSGREIPLGTDEEMSLAYNQVRSYQATLIDYADKEDVPQDTLDWHRRIFYFAKHGPRKGYFKQYPNCKLVSADVLYILSAKIPATIICKKFNISVDTVKGIRNGKDRDWLDEYHLVRRIRKALVCKYKKNWKEKYITTLSHGSDNKVIALFSSKRKAVEYRRDYLIFKLKIPAKEVDAIIKNGSIETLYPIEERTVTD